MFEKIKITVVLDDEKTNMETPQKAVEKVILTQDLSVTLMSVLLKNRLVDASLCGGRGVCGRCEVQFLEGAPLPTAVERTRITPEKLRQGYRLACMARPKTDCVVRVVGEKGAESDIVTEVNLPSGNIDLVSRNKYLSENQKAAAMKSDEKQGMKSKNAIKKPSVISCAKAGAIKYHGKQERIESGCYMVAVDLGTTTIAMQLRDMGTGETADTYCERNPQRVYGTDVLARIQASCAGSGVELRKLVCETLLRGLEQFADVMQGLEKINCMFIAGNTTMEHLLMGYDVETLGQAPFVPVETGLQTIPLDVLFKDVAFPSKRADDILWKQITFPVYIAPCISAFVGGDIVAGLYALHMLQSSPGKEKATALLIDLGTNGEMAITDGKRMIATAVAAGPAFEGDGSLIGTDRIAFTANLLQRGILDETGLLREPYFTEGVCIEKSGCYFRQEDVRALQMAKAAVRAGVEILWEEMGRSEIAQVYLAGGFGYYLDAEAAFAVGLLPSRMRGKVLAVGNTSLAGAYELGRDLYRGEMTAMTLEERLSAVRSINLAQERRFESLYLNYMNLEAD